jgi:transposase, IS6 family
MMAERDITVDPSTVWRCIQSFAHLIVPSWRIDETYLKVNGEWTYLYRSVDKRQKCFSHLSCRRTGSRGQDIPAKSSRDARSKAAYRDA